MSFCHPKQYTALITTQLLSNGALLAATAFYDEGK
jgi:hypothetical protein